MCFHLSYLVLSVLILYFLKNIFSLALHPNKLLIATGQVASIDKRERRVNTILVF